MDAVDEFQEADVLWPDTEDELAPFAATDVVMEEPYGAATASSASSVAPEFGRPWRFQGRRFLPGAGPSSSAAASPDADEEEWQEQCFK